MSSGDVTLHDRFVMAALPAVIAGNSNKAVHFARDVGQAFDYADRCMAERERRRAVAKQDEAKP